MSWSISHVARVSGVSSRTLRYYGQIGLLEPESTEFSGRRMYGQAELLRLQEILLLRELGLPLKSIARILDSRDERDEVLRHHLERVVDERDRLNTQIETITRTIEEGTNMSPQELFEGFAANPYEKEARQRWGDEAVDSSKEKLKNLSTKDAERLQTGFVQIHQEIAQLKASGLEPSHVEVQRVVGKHYELVGLTWTPDAGAYTGLGRMYVEDERFRSSIGEGDDTMVEFLAEAMTIYADTEL